MAAIENRAGTDVGFLFRFQPQDSGCGDPADGDPTSCSPTSAFKSDEYRIDHGCGVYNVEDTIDDDWFAVYSNVELIVTYEVAAVPGDCDGDGDVDLDDYAGLESCLFGPNRGVGGGCECFDFDGSGHIDFLDLAELQVFYGG